jgi:hypothetical protein
MEKNICTQATPAKLSFPSQSTSFFTPEKKTKIKNYSPGKKQTYTERISD